jgi:branched-chain amino acid aminotransferase
LLTPTAADAILPGVTRRHIFKVASEEGFEVSEATLYLDDLHSADEVVLTSSLREVYPAGAVDGQPLRMSGHAARLRAAYHDYVLRSLGV